MITLRQLEQIAERNPNRRINSVIAELRAKEKMEQLRAPPQDYAVEDKQEREPWSFFRRLLGR